MFTKRKVELIAVLDDLRHQDPKRRLAAVLELKEVAAVIGPRRGSIGAYQLYERVP